MLLISNSLISMAQEKYSKYGKVYTNPEGLTVTLFRYNENDDYLLKVKGIDHEWDEKIVLHHLVKETSGDKEEYQTKVGKDNWTTFAVLKDWYGYTYGIMVLPESSKEHKLFIDEKLTKELVTKTIVEDYLKKK